MNRITCRSIAGVLCCLIALSISASADPVESIKMKGKDPIQGRFKGYKSSKFYFEPSSGKEIIKQFAFVQSIEINPPKKVSVKTRKKKNKEEMQLKSFSTDRLRRQNFVFVKDGKDITVPLKDVTLVEVVIDFAREMGTFRVADVQNEGDPNADINVEDLVEEGVVTIVHFHMSSALASVRQGGYVSSLQEKHKGKVKVAVVNVAGWDAKVAKKYNITSAPQFWFYGKDGKLAKKLTTRFTTDDIDSALAASSGGSIKRRRR